MKLNIQQLGNLGALILLMGLSSCSSTKYSQAKLDLPDHFRNSEQLNRSSDSIEMNIATIPYHDFFMDSELLALIDEGISHNNDLNIAVKQIEIASLNYKRAKWANIPTVNLNVGTASINRSSDNSMNGVMFGQLLEKKYTEDYSSTLNISWEADIWGKIKGQKEVALANYLQTYEATKAVKTQLVSQIAQGYYNLLMLDMQLEISNQNITLVDNTLHMIKVQKELGIGTSLSVQQQENARDQILATLPSIKEAISIQENVLSVLTGRMPGAIQRNYKLTEMKTPAYQSVGIPSELLSYRPDVKSSELLVQQAFSNVKIAKKSMYPSLNITAQGGLNAFEFKNWFEIPGSLFGMAAGSLAQPLLNGKQLKTQYKQAKIAREQAELGFKQTVLNAVAEVSNILATMESVDEQEKIIVNLANRSQEAVETAEKMFQHNMVTYLDVILAQNNKLQAELSLASIKQQKLSAVVNLYRALGGGGN